MAASSGRERDPHLSRFDEDRGNQWCPFDERNQRMGSVFVSLARVLREEPGSSRGELFCWIVCVGAGWRAEDTAKALDSHARGSRARGNDRMDGSLVEQRPRRRNIRCF
jgi:hypothetical protein